MRELQPGLWHWQAAHPEWSPRAPYSREVSSYALDDGTRLLLFDPLAVPGELLDLVLWIEKRRALVAGDLLSGLLDGSALQYKWLRKGVSREKLAEGLRPLLGLPIEIVLPAHGAPTDRAALERALS